MAHCCENVVLEQWMLASVSKFKTTLHHLPKLVSTQVGTTLIYNEQAFLDMGGWKKLEGPSKGESPLSRAFQASQGDHWWF